ncbi:MAG: hypothetical protein JRH01_18930 [Deltaproteobacteria bacterium]|nr:hypothetical protein [Deltaproteobacteria bacterium]MBW2393994.1 hypothetical protein [Deltaproteobacteria bacterium]
MTAALRRLSAIGLLLLAVAPACSPHKALWELGLGSWTTELVVVRLVPRHVFWEVQLAGHGLSLQVYVPESEACAAVLRVEQRVDYVERGPGGRFVRDDLHCDTVGIGAPLIGRARQPRGPSSASMVPRAQATFQTVFTDDEVVMLRGRFPLANRVGWAGSGDTIAVVANDPSCHRAVEGGRASMEFRAAGRNTLSLISGKQLCRIVGLILPPAPE